MNKNIMLCSETFRCQCSRDIALDISEINENKYLSNKSANFDFFTLLLLSFVELFTELCESSSSKCEGLENNGTFSIGHF